MRSLIASITGTRPGGRPALGRREPFWQRIHVDPWLLLLILVLATIAGFVLYSASSMSMALLYRQAAAYCIGLAVMLVIAQFQPRFMERWVPVAYIACLLLLVAVELVGVQSKGAQRWLSIPGVMRFQPSEIVKLVMPMIVAWYLARHALPPSFKSICITLVIILVPVVLILKQPDLGTSLLVAIAGLFALLMAGLRWRYIIGALVLLVPIATAMWFFVLHEYQKRRVMTFMNPESDPLRCGLEHYPVQGGNRLWRCVRQGLVAGYAVAPGLSARRPYRLHYRRTGRRIWPGGRLFAADCISAGDRQGVLHHPAGAGYLQQIAGWQYHPDLLYLRDGQYRYGQRLVASGRRALAIDQLRRDIAGDFALGFRHSHVNSYAPQVDGPALVDQTLRATPH